MEFCIDEVILRKTFFNKKGFLNKTNEKIGIFPFTLNTDTKDQVKSFNHAVGAFFRRVYDKKEPIAQDKEEILSKICQDIDFNHADDKVLFQDMIRELYFEKQGIKSFHLNAYQQLQCTSREDAIAGYLLDVLADKALLQEKITQNRAVENNLLERLILKHIPELLVADRCKVQFYCECPELKEWFMKDLLFLWETDCTDKDSIVRMMELYFFTSVTKTLIRIDKMFEKWKSEDEHLYYCVKWEKTARNRLCYKHGWKEVESRVWNMACHAVLLELLNQNGSGMQYDYKDLYKIYQNATHEEQKQMYEQIVNLKQKYMKEYIADWEFAERQVSEKHEYDIFAQLDDFLKVIREQFDGTTRKRARKAFAERYLAFAHHAILKNRYSMGYMLELTEEDVLLLAKLALNGKDRIRRIDLFREMESRGIYVDEMTQEQIIRYFEKLNMIEKKSDSGDAQYVKGIL